MAAQVHPQSRVLGKWQPPKRFRKESKIMNKIRLFAVAVTCAATMSVLSPTMSAGLWDKRTIVTFSGAVEVPGTILQPGRYIMKLVDSPSDRHIVQFSNERENHVFATVLAIPAWRENPSDKSVFTFYEAPVGQPQAMKTWYYPGDNFGQEFVYPKERLALLLAGVNRVDSSNTLARQAEPAETKVEEPARTEALSSPAIPEEKSSDNDQVTIAQNTAPEIQNPPPLAPSDNRVAEPAPDTSNQTLPKTASNFWEIGLIGLGSIIAASGVRKLRRRSS
jgi:hypothetical protein